MKTFKYFTIALIALSFLFACEPEEEIVPDIQVKENITSINLEAKTIELDNQLSIEINWEGNLNNQAGFVVERSPNDSTHWSEIARLGNKATSFIDVELPEDANGFYYRIKAIEQGDKPNSFFTISPIFIPVYAFIAAPSELIITASSSSAVELSWQDNANNENGFIIERSLNGNTWAELKSVRTGTTTFQDRSVQANTTCYYRVLAYADNPRDSSNPNKSTPSNITEITTPWKQCLQSGSSHSQSFLFTQSCELVNVTIVGNVTMYNGTLKLTNCFINGNITQHGNGDIIIKREAEVPGVISQVNGNIKEYGDGSIKVEESKVLGNIEENSTGDISILNKSFVGKNSDFITLSYTYVVNERDLGDIIIENSKVEAHIGEKHSGSIIVTNDGYIIGDISEQEGGDIIIQNSIAYAKNIGEQGTGNIKFESSKIFGEFGIPDVFSQYADNASRIAEEGNGSILVSGSKVIGNLAENGHGNIDIKNNSTIGNREFRGNVNEEYGGHVYLRDNSVIWGNLKEGGYGTIYLNIPSNVYGNYAFD